MKINLSLGTLDALPALPDIAQKLLALHLDTDAGETEMIRLIEQDPLLSAKVIGLANAPVMGLGRKISSVSDAAMLLGMRRLKYVSIGIATLSMITNQPATKYFDPQDLFLHSMTVAIVMNLLSRAMPKSRQPDENLVFLSGLLHDIGLMALHHLNAEASNELHHQINLQPNRPIHELEMDLLGITHCQIGAQLVQHWNLPQEIISVVEMHHSGWGDFIPLNNPLVRLVCVAEKILPDFGIPEHTKDLIDVREWQELGIECSLEDELSGQANELALQIAQMPDKHGATTHADIETAPSNSATENSVLAEAKIDKAKLQTNTDEVLYQSRIEIGRLLQNIASENISVTADIGDEQFFVSHILFVNQDMGHFLIAYAEHKPVNILLFKNPSLKLTSNYHGAHLSFKVLEPSDIMYDGHPALQFTFPRAILFHHRREHKRIRIPKDVSLNLVTPWGDSTPIEISVVDISMDGFGCIHYTEGDMLKPGTVLKGCRILLPNGSDVAVDLIVRHTSPTTLKDGTIAYRTGVRFIQTPKEIEPLINHFVKYIDNSKI